MNKEELNRLLDNIYELEGLVHLALAREDCPESLPSLIVRKAKALTDLVNKTDNKDEVSSEVSAVDQSDVCDNEKSESDAIIDEKIEETEPVEVPIMEDIHESSEPASMSRPLIDEIEESAFASYTLPVEEEIVIEDKISSIEDSVHPIDPVKQEEATQPSVRRESLSPEIPHRNVEPRGKLVFTINDRYRFKRDLFCNSDVDFNTTLALVASMDSYDEAEDYFLGELQWNPQREEVMDFLEILKNYFK